MKCVIFFFRLDHEYYKSKIQLNRISLNNEKIIKSKLKVRGDLTRNKSLFFLFFNISERILLIKIVIYQ